MATVTIDEQAPTGRDAEALIREARLRKRRRWARRSAIGVIAGALVALASVLVGGGSSGVIAQTARTPFVNVRAFSHEGDLAFVSRGRLWVLDGSAGTVRELPTPRGYAAARPSFSHDGRWLAYLAEPNQSNGPGQLWLARASGVDAHRVAGESDQLYGWSPASDVLVASFGDSRRIPYNSPTQLDLVTPAGRRSPIVNLFAGRGWGLALYGAVWSPSGDRLAVSTYLPRRRAGSVIRIYSGGRLGASTVWFEIKNPQRLSGACEVAQCSNQVVTDLAGWWPQWGLGFWVFAGGMDHNNDSTPLMVMRRPRATPKLIGQTLSDGVTDAVDPGPDGRLAIVSSAQNFGRQYTGGKWIESCAASTGRCAPLRGATTWTGRFTQPCPCSARDPRPGHPGSGVTEDPAWSPDGSELAYVKAPTIFNAQFPATAWYDAHSLYVLDVATGSTKRIGTVDGASAPAWVGSRNLLYVSHDGLWLANVKTSRAVEIERPLFTPSVWNSVGTAGDLSYYGQVPLGQQFAQSSP